MKKESKLEVLPRKLQHQQSNLLTQTEKLRLQALLDFELEARQEGFTLIAGIDEAGRGPLAGPVVAAACVIPKDLFVFGVDDSKKLTPLQRRRVFEDLTRDARIDYAVGIVSHEEIDRINILQATIQAMLQAVCNLKCKPDLLLVDGLKLPHSTPSRKIIKGDSRSYSIAAASIIAKESRDQIMRAQHEKWPHYGFNQHKGYGTAMHRAALQKHGPCPIHRLTFEPVKSMVLT